MRLSFSADSLTERLGLLFGQVPLPVGRAFFGMPMGRGVGVAQRMGIFRELAAGPASAAELAERVEAQPERLRMLLDLLTGDRLLKLRDGRYSLGTEARRWLDPSSPRYVGTYIEHTLDYWEWWGDLERVVRGGDSSRSTTSTPRTLPGRCTSAASTSWHGCRRARSPAR